MSDKKMKIEVMRGVEGNSIYLDDMRIAGNKPYGGGDVIEMWDTSIEDILLAIAENQKENKKTYEFSYNDKYKVTIERI